MSSDYEAVASARIFGVQPAGAMGNSDSIAHHVILFRLPRKITVEQEDSCSKWGGLFCCSAVPSLETAAPDKLAGLVSMTQELLLKTHVLVSPSFQEAFFFLLAARSHI